MREGEHQLETSRHINIAKEGRMTTETKLRTENGFPLSSKTNISKFQFDLGMHGHV